MGKEQDAGEKPRAEAIIESLVLRPEAAHGSMLDLWIMFVAELSAHSLNPKKIYATVDPEKSVYRYDSGPGRKTISYTVFASLVKDIRRTRGEEVDNATHQHEQSTFDDTSPRKQPRVRNGSRKPMGIGTGKPIQGLVRKLLVT